MDQFRPTFPVGVAVIVALAAVISAMGMTETGSAGRVPKLFHLIGAAKVLIARRHLCDCHQRPSMCLVGAVANLVVVHTIAPRCLQARR